LAAEFSQQGLGFVGRGQTRGAREIGSLPDDAANKTAALFPGRFDPLAGRARQSAGNISTAAIERWFVRRCWQRHTSRKGES
jgi:hypothetical protein